MGSAIMTLPVYILSDVSVITIATVTRLILIIGTETTIMVNVVLTFVNVIQTLIIALDMITKGITTLTITILKF